MLEMDELNDDQLQNIMFDLVQRIEKAMQQQEDWTAEQEITFLLITANLSELVFYYSKKFFIDSKIMPVMRMFFTERWQIETLKDVHWYNYTKLSLFIKI